MKRAHRHQSSLAAHARRKPLASITIAESGAYNARGSLLSVMAAILLSLLPALAATAADDDDDDDDTTAPGAPLVLTRAQVAAVGIAIAHPVGAAPMQHISAFGRVLDAAALVTDFADLDSTRAAEGVSGNEAERLRVLRAGGVAASLKAVQAAQSEQAKTRAQADATAARLAARWGPLASMPASDRATLLRGLREGHIALLRADVPGRQSLTTLPRNAQVSIDGIGYAARVQGVLRGGDGESINPALLLELRSAPLGLSVGARLAVSIEGEKMLGFIVPRAALLHDEQGAHVYQQLDAKGEADTTRYVRRNVELLMAVGEGWLVRGLDVDDSIVVRGAGLLWSMQGGAAADDD